MLKSLDEKKSQTEAGEAYKTTRKVTPKTLEKAQQIR